MEKIVFGTDEMVIIEKTETNFTWFWTSKPSKIYTSILSYGLGGLVIPA